MRTIVAGVLMAVAGGLAAAGQPTTETKKMTWEKELVPAYQKALKEGKPLVVVFTADWCEHCVKQNEMFEKDRVLDPYADKAVFVKVDIDKDDSKGNVKRLMDELGIKNVPTVVVLDVSTEALNERGRVIGHFPAAAFSEHFGKVMNTPKGGKM